MAVGTLCCYSYLCVLTPIANGWTGVACWFQIRVWSFLIKRRDLRHATYVAVSSRCNGRGRGEEGEVGSEGRPTLIEFGFGTMDGVGTFVRIQIHH
jgi:hypothetical protein